MATQRNLVQEARFTPWQLTAGKRLALAGLMVVMAVVIVGIVVAGIVAGYYENPKDVRDAAAAGSDVLANQGTIAAVQAWLAPLKFVGSFDDPRRDRRDSLGYCSNPRRSGERVRAGDPKARVRQIGRRAICKQVFSTSKET